MINRKNELIYKKRHHFLRFKPLLDLEYKNFGYKKCEEQTKKKSLIKKTYYVRHKERPFNLTLSILYGLNFPLSIYRSFLCPILIALLPTLIIIFSILNLIINNSDFNDFTQKIYIWNILLVLATLPIMLISALLANLGKKVYKKQSLGPKTDRALSSRGWDLWSSYNDNDPRFCPPDPNFNKNKKDDLGASKNKPVSPDNLSNMQIGDVKSTSDEDVEVISLLNNDGEEIDFIEIAAIAYKGEFYAMLQPVEMPEGMDEDEALVFHVTKDSNNEDKYNIVVDDDIIKGVFEEYNRILNQSKR